MTTREQSPWCSRAEAATKTTHRIKTMKPIDEIKQIAERLNVLCGKSCSLAITRHNPDGPMDITLNVHSYDSSYKKASTFMSNLGIKTREKDPHETYTRLSGTAENGIQISTYPDELPPTCKLETYIEKVPKTLVVDVPGEFIEVTRTKVVCPK